MNHPTMRTLFGAPATAGLEAKATALIVIDFQMEYFSNKDQGKMYIPDGEAAMRQARALIDFADARGIAVFHLQHLAPAGGPIFAEGGPTAEIHPEIVPLAHHTLLQKRTVSSFGSTDLHAQLQARGIKTLIICGLMTHMCVSTTARDAAAMGYEVIIASDACATRGIDSWDGGTVSHDALHRAALTEVADGFGEVLPTARLTALDVR